MFEGTSSPERHEAIARHEHAGHGGGLARVFRNGASRNPDAAALIVDGATCTFAEVEETARRWAARLCELREGHPRRIGICAYRSKTTYLGILAAVLSGASFVPLNPRFPSARTRQMVEQAELDAVLVDRASLPSLTSAIEDIAERPPLLITDAGRSEVNCTATFDADELRQAPPLGGMPCAGPNDIAYLLFTSGSTGAPKGVPITNSNVCSYLAYNRRRYGLTADDRLTQTFDHTFDLSIFDMFMAWSAGAAVAVLKNADLLSPVQFIEEHGITLWFSVPSLATLLMRRRLIPPGSMKGLRWSLFCGEALPKPVAEAWQAAAPNSTLENLYGPTELTITCAAHRWNAKTSPGLCERGIVPIGRVYPGLSHLIVDDALKPVRKGEAGELCIAGPQTFPGYWRADWLTRDRVFERRDRSGSTLRYYRTGDLVHRLSGGEHVFLGRRDSQVKIKGYRVELGEIEAVLRQSGCTEAIALPWPDRDKAEAVVAFITGEASPAALRASARERLPAYMVPRRIESIDVMPINVNGKIDRLVLGRRAAALTLAR